MRKLNGKTKQCEKAAVAAAARIKRKQSKRKKKTFCQCSLECDQFKGKVKLNVKVCSNDWIWTLCVGMCAHSQYIKYMLSNRILRETQCILYTLHP